MGIEKVILISPRGFCAGVDRAIGTVLEALEMFGPPVYVKHEIVHNKAVCDALREKGAIFIEEVNEVPEDAVCIYSAHGIKPSVREDAKKRNLRTIDATCPLVTKIHMEVIKFANEGKEIIYIGHKNHPEAIGVLGIRPEATMLVETAQNVEKLKVKNPEKLVYLTQTTLSLDDCAKVINALEKKFPKMSSPPSDDICYATKNRQAAVKKAAEECEVILVVGSKTSSNSNRLVDAAKGCGREAHLVDTIKDIKEEWLAGKKTVGITSGASAPEELVQEIARTFVQNGAKPEELIVINENTKFIVPAELTALRPAEKKKNLFELPVFRLKQGTGL